jgi:hypothetical protein
MSKERAAKIANSEGASSRGGKKSGSGGDSSQGGTTAQKKEAGRKGGRASAGKGALRALDRRPIDTRRPDTRGARAGTRR